MTLGREYSLRRRLVVAMSLVFLLGVGGSAGYYYFEAYAVGDDLHERTLQGQARELIDAMTLAGNGNVRVNIAPGSAALYASSASGFYYTLYDGAQMPVASSSNLSAPLPLIEAPPLGSFGPLRFVGAMPDPMATLSAGAPDRHTLVVGRSDPDDDALAFSLIEEGAEGLYLVLMPFAFISLLIIWAVTDWSLRPVARASKDASRIGPANPSARIATQGLPNEIQPLVAAVNGALERLADAYTKERRLTADAAHELRTPLAVLNLRLQQAKIRNVMDWPKIEGEIATMNRLVNQLLDLARKETSAHSNVETGMVSVNLSRIVREAAAMVLPLAEEAGREIEIDVPDTVVIRGISDDLRDMVRNLLDNSLVHGCGTARVRIKTDASPDKFIYVDVEDEGPGLSGALGEDIFTRFRKGRPSSPGAGLGLAIVRQVARNHGGDATFIQGPSWRIRISLPAI